MNRPRSLTAAILIGLLGLLPLFVSLPAHAQKKPPKKNLMLKVLRPEGATGASNSTVSIDVATGMSSVLGTSGSKSGLFDGYYVDGLQRLQLEANITDNPNDIDEEKQSRAGQRALTMKVGQTMSTLLNQSDLRSVYRSTVKNLQRARDAVRVSVQKSDQGYSVGTKKKGKKLLELDVEPSDKTLLSPELKFVDDTARMRYDQSRKALMLEFRTDW